MNFNKNSRFNAALSLEEVANRMGLSRQRVHEIEARAINKLRHAFVREMPSLKLRKNENGRVCGLTEVYYNTSTQPENHRMPHLF
jgi:predicted DNA-binding protein YlxM (UPF0122 family)